MARHHSPDELRDVRVRLQEVERRLADAHARTSELETASKKLGEGLHKEFEHTTTELASKYRAETAREMATVKDSIDSTIDRRIKMTWVLAGVILLILAAVGYIAVIPSTVSAAIGDDARREMKAILDKAKEQAAEIKAFKDAAKPQPSIVLQTDYGIGGPYMPALKGVILSRNPFARIDVVCTTIDAFDVLQASWYLWRSCRYYPAGTVFVCITNPGGITRDQIVLRSCTGQFFVGHDNGCFDLIAEKDGVEELYKIGSTKYMTDRVNDPFGGVDVFGPIASDLAKGGSIADVGLRLESYSPKLSRRVPEIKRDYLLGTIMDIDVFGNATVDLPQDECEAAGWRVGQVLRVTIGGKTKALLVPLKVTYGHVSRGSPVALFYDGMVQLAVNEGSFKTEYAVLRGDEVQITR